MGGRPVRIRVRPSPRSRPRAASQAPSSFPSQASVSSPEPASLCGAARSSPVAPLVPRVAPPANCTRSAPRFAIGAPLVPLRGRSALATCSPLGRSLLASASLRGTASLRGLHFLWSWSPLRFAEPLRSRRIASPLGRSLRLRLCSGAPLRFVDSTSFGRGVHFASRNPCARLRLRSLYWEAVNFLSKISDFSLRSSLAPRSTPARQHKNLRKTDI